MEYITLYRGIAVEKEYVDVVVSHIREYGLYISNNSFWRSGFTWFDLRNISQQLLSKSGLQRNETDFRPTYDKVIDEDFLLSKRMKKGICFADRGTANYYAFFHNRKSDNHIPIVISIDVNISNICVDGRDFLYTVFGALRNKIINNFREILCELYGDKINIYTDKVLNDTECDPFAVCDLAIIDNDVIRGHLQNKTLILGRNGTQFKNAFYVQTPIFKQFVNEIVVNSYYSDNSNKIITLNDIRRI